MICWNTDRPSDQSEGWSPPRFAATRPVYATIEREADGKILARILAYHVTIAPRPRFTKIVTTRAIARALRWEAETVGHRPSPAEILAGIPLCTYDTAQQAHGVAILLQERGETVCLVTDEETP